MFEAGGDILQTDVLADALQGADGVFHFAALWLLHCHEYPRAAFDVNIRGSFNVFEACVAANVERLVYSSSASVYGDAVEEPMTEDHPFNNTNFYGATKIAGEAMLRALHHRYGLPYAGLRYMNVYGPRQDYHGAYIAVIMKMLDAIERGDPLVVYGDGSQAYDFVYVGDCAQANVCAMQADTVDRFYNVGTGLRTTIAELAKLLLEVSGSDVGDPLRAGGIDLRDQPDRLGGARRDRDRVRGPRAARRRAAEAARVARARLMEHRHVPIALPSTGDEEWEALREPLQSGWLTQGPVVRRFEEAFARRHDVPHALATTSCTTALHLALAALGIGPGDEVIVPAFTWIATANAVVYCGATPVFVDVDPAHLQHGSDIDRRGLDTPHACRRPRPSLRPVCRHGGDSAQRSAGRPPIVEDAACAAGASYQERPAGGLGDVACFSFHPRKSITTGEGGMLVTTDADLAGRAEQLRNHGAAVPEEVRHHGPAPFLLPDFDELGFNYRMTDLQAAVGLVQLSKLDGFIDERAQWAKWYCRGARVLRVASAARGARRRKSRLAGVRHRGRRRCSASGATTSWRDCTSSVSPRAPGRTRCRRRATTGAGSMSRLMGIPVASRLQDRSMAIPLHNRMTADDYEYVVAAIRAAVGAP